jgi:hypothetical protein
LGLGLDAGLDAAGLGDVAGGAVKCPNRNITVLGSGRDVANYVDRPGFNTFTGKGIDPLDWNRENALWLNRALQNGDEFWLVTNPTAHQNLMTSVGAQSAYLNLELPMVSHYSDSEAFNMYLMLAK